MLMYPETWADIPFPQYRDELIDSLKNLACPSAEALLARSARDNSPESALDYDLDFLYDDMHLKPDEFSRWTPGVFSGEAEIAAINALMKAVEAAGGRGKAFRRIDQAFAHPEWPQVTARAQEALDILLLRGEARYEPDPTASPDGGSASGEDAGPRSSVPRRGILRRLLGR